MQTFTPKNGWCVESARHLFLRAPDSSTGLLWRAVEAEVQQRDLFRRSGFHTWTQRCGLPVEVEGLFFQSLTALAESSVSHRSVSSPHPPLTRPSPSPQAART